MYDYGYDYSTSYYGNTVTSNAGNGFGVFGIVMLALTIFLLVSMWKVYKKAGKPGWASIVPIYNYIVLIEIAGLPMWYFALFFVPFANIYAIFKIYIEVAHKFGKSTGFGVGLVFFNIIFYPILAFGSATYGSSISNNDSASSQTNQEQNFVNNQNISQINDNVQNPTIMDFNNPSNVSNRLNSNNNAFSPVGNLSNNIINDSVTESQNIQANNPVSEQQAAPEVNQVVPEVPVAPEVNPVQNNVTNNIN